MKNKHRKEIVMPKKWEDEDELNRLQDELMCEMNEHELEIFKRYLNLYDKLTEQNVKERLLQLDPGHGYQ